MKGKKKKADKDRKRLFTAPVRAIKRRKPKPFRKNDPGQVYVPFIPFEAEEEAEKRAKLIRDIGLSEEEAAALADFNVTGTMTFRYAGTGPPNATEVPRGTAANAIICDDRQEV